MNKWREAICSVTVLITLTGCSTQPATVEHQQANKPLETKQTEVAPQEEKVGYVNKVWQGSQSTNVAPGSMYVFLSDGTLVMTAPNSKPSFGSWKDEGGNLTMIEEGISYKTDILKLSKDEFKIRSNNPRGAVEITLVPAERAFPSK